MIIDAINMFLPGVALVLLSMWGALLWLMHPRSKRGDTWVTLARICIETAMAVMSHAPKRDSETIARLVVAWWILAESRDKPEETTNGR